MRLNEDTAVFTEHILLVPYEERHVPLYHQWMQDKDIQTATASEPLTIEEEYAMQQSWRTDGDKLTFIICKPLQKTPILDHASSAVVAGTHDAAERMLGDVNLFISPSEDDPQLLIGELELMIADTAMQGKGFGRFAFLAFLKYITTYEEHILREYRAWVGNVPVMAGTSVNEGGESNEGEDTSIGGAGERIVGNTRFHYLRARISSNNTKSLALFEHAGFELQSAEPNYFGELEMRMEGHFLGEDDRQFTREWWGDSWRVNGWKLLKYQQSTNT